MYCQCVCVCFWDTPFITVALGQNYKIDIRSKYHVNLMLIMI